MIIEIAPWMLARLQRLARIKHWPVEMVVTEAVRTRLLEWEQEEGIYDAVPELAAIGRREPCASPVSEPD